jgi:hypothetical protein
MNIVEWTHLITAAITWARLARQGPDQNHEAGIEHLPIKTQVEVYIVTLCQRMADVGAGNVQDDPRGLFSWFHAIAQGIRLWVWGSEESRKLKPWDSSMNGSITSASETVKRLTSQNESNRHSSNTSKANTTDRDSTENIQTTWSDGFESVLDDNFWDVFVSHGPDITMPSGLWKGGATGVHLNVRGDTTW